MTSESTVITVADSYNTWIDSYIYIYILYIFEPAFSPIYAATQVKNACVGLIENLTTASIEDELIKT